MLDHDGTETLRQHVRALDEALAGLRRERESVLEATRSLEGSVEARAIKLGSTGSVLGGLLVVVAAVAMGLVSAATSGSRSRTYYGHVAAVSGAALMLPGARCTTFVSDANSEDYDAQVSVLCEGRVIYGGGSLGYVDCDDHSGAFTRCVDETFSSQGGDPKMVFDDAAQTVRVEDASPAWAVEIAFGGGRP